MEEKE